VSHLSCGDNQVAVFQGVDDVFLVFVCRVFREFMEVVVVELITHLNMDISKYAVSKNSDTIQ
jgi:hypothetical protein